MLEPELKFIKFMSATNFRVVHLGYGSIQVVHRTSPSG